MKKRLVYLVVLFMIGLSILSGCGNSDEIQGKFCSLEEAYELGWITQDDIKEICYNRFGEVWIGEDLNDNTWIKIDYTPIHSLGHIDKKVENAIKKTYYKLNENKFFDKDGKSIGGIDDISVHFFGVYNDSYILNISCSLWGIGDAVTPMLLAGVAWWESGEGFCVFRINENILEE